MTMKFLMFWCFFKRANMLRSDLLIIVKHKENPKASVSQKRARSIPACKRKCQIREQILGFTLFKFVSLPITICFLPYHSRHTYSYISLIMTSCLISSDSFGVWLNRLILSLPLFLPCLHTPSIVFLMWKFERVLHAHTHSCVDATPVAWNYDRNTRLLLSLVSWEECIIKIPELQRIETACPNPLSFILTSV